MRPEATEEQHIFLIFPEQIDTDGQWFSNFVKLLGCYQVTYFLTKHSYNLFKCIQIHFVFCSVAKH